MKNAVDRAGGGPSIIVVGVDFSATSYDAVTLALDIVRATGGVDMHFLHVLKTPGLTSPEAVSGSVSEYEEAIRAAERELDAVCESAVDRGLVRAIAHVRTGEPHIELVQLASDVDADLLVVGSHGRTGLSRLLVGSVAEKVQRHARCPVLTVKPKTVHATSAVDAPCSSCLQLREETHGTQLWCEQHVNVPHKVFPHRIAEQDEDAGPEWAALEQCIVGPGRGYILIVEDDPDVLQGLAEVIEGEGYSVVGCSDGETALQRATNGADAPAMIILDFMLPHMDGWAFLEERQKYPRLARVPVLGMSASQRFADRHELPRGVDEFLPKPFEVESVLRSIGRLCA